jgi:hypothetical protein
MHGRAHRPPQHWGVTLRVLPWLLVSLLTVAACGGQVAGSGDVASVAVPTEVRCVDAARLKQAAADDRTKGAAVNSDQRRVSADNRANFFASLAIIAGLASK